MGNAPPPEDPSFTHGICPECGQELLRNAGLPVPPTPQPASDPRLPENGGHDPAQPGSHPRQSVRKVQEQPPCTLVGRGMPCPAHGPALQGRCGPHRRHSICDSLPRSFVTGGHRDPAPCRPPGCAALPCPLRSAGCCHVFFEAAMSYTATVCFTESPWRTGPVPFPDLGPALGEHAHRRVYCWGGDCRVDHAYLLGKAGQRVVVLEGRTCGSGETGQTSAHLSSALDDRFVELERIHGKEGARLAGQSHAAAIARIEAIAPSRRDRVRLPARGRIPLHSTGRDAQRAGR